MNTPRDILLQPDKLVYTIGRDEDNEIYLNSPQVSRFHAQINVVGEKSIEIEDLDSRHGTTVNGRKVKRQELHDGDKVVVGVFEFIIQINGSGMLLKFPLKKTEGNFVAEYDLSRHSSQLIGRGKNCTIVLDSQQVSRVHARIELENEHYTVMDLGSTNGTFVNGKRLEKKILKDRDIIQVGPIRFLFLNAFIYQLNEKDLVRIDLANVSRTTGGHDILRDISLGILPREFVGILGPSGSGKSSLINVMNGNAIPTRGMVNLNGADFYKNYSVFKNIVGYVPQEDIVHHELSVYDTLFYAAELRLSEDMNADEKKKRVEKVITTLELDERKETPIHRLSGGQRKRVSLGVELLTEPSILFLDEPTSGLDPGLEQKMMQLFRRIADSGQTVIMATHVLNEINLFDLVAIIFEGDLVYFGPPSDITRYFKVEKPNDVYNRLYYPPEGGWVQRFKSSLFYKDYVLGRLKAAKEVPGASPSAEGEEVTEAPREELDKMIFFSQSYSPFRQFRVLTRRYVHIISKDIGNVLILLGQAPTISLLLVLVFLRFHNIWSLLFCLSLSSIWFGCINSVKEITKEKHIYARERVVSLKITSYIFSKISILSLLCFLQCLVLVTGVAAFLPIEGNVFYMFWVVFASSIGGLTLGLMISSMVDSTDKALALLPLVLIPQILFSGTVVNIDDMIPASQGISNFMICRWSYGLLKKISVWDRGFQFDTDFLILLAFLPAFVAATLYFQRRKDVRH